MFNMIGDPALGS